MFKNILLATAVASGLGSAAVADTAGQTVLEGEALAWSVASYASCQDDATLQRDFRAEVARGDADESEVLAALSILAEADNVCGSLNDFSIAMLQLSTTDFTRFEAMLLVKDDPAAPEFDLDPPEGNGRLQTSVILDASSLPPALSGSPMPTSDYQ